MASISVPCPKCPATARGGAWSRNPDRVPNPLSARSFPAAGSVRFPRLQGSGSSPFPALKAQVQEIAVESPSTISSSKIDSQPKQSETAPEVEELGAAPDSTISVFMAEVSNLVKFVDSKDVVELQLKKGDLELTIRKKEALPQPSVPAAPVMMQYPQAMLPPQPTPQVASPPPSASPAAAASTPALPPPSKVGSKSSLPALKCPMAGTFYRSPAPGEPPFVKVGDKVQKGQVVCIIEAMKLMNEIEADQSGTVVEIVAEDGKPVSVDTPLLVIQP